MRRILIAFAVVIGIVTFRIAGTTGDFSSGAEYADGTWIVGTRPGIDPRMVIKSSGISAGVVAVSDDYFLMKTTGHVIARLATRDDVLSVEPDRPVRLETVQTTGPTGFASPNNLVPWGIDALDSHTSSLDDSYTYTNDGTGVDVYVIDTGVQANHPEFANVTAGWGYRRNATALSSYQTALTTPDPKDPGHYMVDPCPYNSQNQLYDPATFDAVSTPTDDGTTDNDGHGTHVAGIVGGTLTGVAKGANIIPVRALDSCGVGTPTMIIEALKWIVSNHTNRRAVVNMSLGLSGTSASINTQIGYLINEGVVVIAAAGNSAVTSCDTSPAGTPGVISVGASGAQFAEANFSNFGACVHIFAPGGSLTTQGYAVAGQGILSAWPKLSGVTNTYREEWGTSMAAPHVSGAVAQYLQSIASWPVADVTKVAGNALSWLKKNASCNLISYYDTGRAAQTPNLFLNIGSPPEKPCAPTGITKTQESGRSTISWTGVPSGNGSDVTGYQVTTSPATTGCSTNASTFTCALTGLVDGTRYTVSVQAINSVGTGTAGTLSLVAGTTGQESTTTVATTTTTEAPTTTTTAPPPPTTVPAVTPTADAPVTAVSSTKSLLLSWPAVTSAEAVTYIVLVSPGGVSCRTSNTSCTFVGVSVGTVYNFSIVARTASGQSSVALRYTVTAGVNQKYTSVRKSSRTTLSAIVSSLSKGARTYMVTSGKCKVSAGRLVAPAATGVCKVKVSIARYSTYKAMSAVLTIQVV